MKAVWLLLLALAVATPAAPVDLRARSTSASHQFVIYCTDVGVRNLVASFVDEVKRDVLEILGEPDRWKIPIVVSLQFPDETTSTSPVTLRLSETPEGPTIQVGVVVGEDPAAIHLQKHIMRAVLLDYIYRDHPPKGGEAYVEAPWWVIDGAIEMVRRRDRGIDAELFERMIETNKMPRIAELLAARGEGAANAADSDSACAHVLLQLLIDLPEGKQRLCRFLRDWPEAHGDAVAALGRAFPALGAGGSAIQKWWTLNVARFGASSRYRGLSAEASDRELQRLLEFDVATDKFGNKKRFELSAFKEFMRLPGGRAAAGVQQRAVIALSVQCNSVFRPVLVDYEAIFALLAKGRTKGIAERIDAAEIKRKAALRPISDIKDYIAWSEATQRNKPAGQTVLRATPASEPPRPMTAREAVIAAYREMLEEKAK